MPTESGRRIPEATVSRLPQYYRVLLENTGDGVVTISSDRLAEMAGVNAAKVRKDLSYLGSFGTRGVGYDVEYLLHEIARELGLTQDWPCVIVGIGNLGAALANYGGFGQRGFRVVALADADTAKIGTRVAELEIEPITELTKICEREKITIAIIATPQAESQDVADTLVDAGVKSILNFASGMLNVPAGVAVRKVDLATELQILSFYQLRNGNGSSGSVNGTGHE